MPRKSENSLLPPEPMTTAAPIPADEAAPPAPVTVSVASLNLNALVKKTDFASLKPKQVLAMVILAAPKKCFFRTWPDEGAWMTLTTIWRKKSIAAIDEQVAILPDEIVPYAPPDLVNTTIFVPYQTTQGEVGIWPLKLPAADRQATAWLESAVDAARIAQTKWLRLETAATHYNYLESKVVREPDFKGLDIDKFFELGLKKYVISSSDDPTLRELRGEIF